MFIPLFSPWLCCGIESHDEYDELRKARPAAEFHLHQQNQETNNRGAKAFRDKARELTMPFFLNMGEDVKVQYVKQQAFGVTGSPIFQADHPAILDCLETTPPVVQGEDPGAPWAENGWRWGPWGGGAHGCTRVGACDCVPGWRPCPCPGIQECTLHPARQL